MTTYIFINMRKEKTYDLGTMLITDDQSWDRKPVPNDHLGVIMRSSQ